MLHDLSFGSFIAIFVVIPLLCICIYDGYMLSRVHRDALHSNCTHYNHWDKLCKKGSFEYVELDLQQRLI